MLNPFNEMGILVVSCDRYSDLWPPFFESLFRHWPNCSLPIYLLSNNKTYVHDKVIPIKVGKDEGWSVGMRKGLEQFPHDNVLIILEDLFLFEPIDDRAVKELANYFLEKKLGYLRLVPLTPAKTPLTDMPSIGIIHKGEKYRTALQIAFWKKTLLQQLLVDKETAWDFEWIGARRSDELPDVFMGVTKGVNPIPRLHGVIRGKWDKEILNKLISKGIYVDTSARQVENIFDRWRRLSPIFVALAMLKKHLLRQY